MLKNLVRYLLLLLLMGFLTILYEREIMEVIFLSMAVFPFLLFGILSYVYGTCRVELLPNQTMANRGDKLSIPIQIKNPTIFPILNLRLYITYKNQYSPQNYQKIINVSVDGKSSTELTFHMISGHVGQVEVMITKVRMFDYLYLFSLGKKNMSRIQVPVMPKLYPIEGDVLSNHTMEDDDSEVFSSLHPGSDPSEVFDIREYREGDRLQKIHWKLSVKQDQWMVKEFSDPVEHSIQIFVDLYLPESDPIQRLHFMDAILESTLSLSYSILAQGYHYDIVWYEEQNQICKRTQVEKEGDLYAVMEELLQVQPYQNQVNLTEIYQAYFPKDILTNIIYITPEISKIQIETFALRGTRASKILYINQKPMPENVEKFLEEIGIGYTVVKYDRIEESLRHLKFY